MASLKNTYTEKITDEQKELIEKHQLFDYFKIEVKGEGLRVNVWKCYPCFEFGHHKGYVHRLNIEKHLSKKGHLDNLSQYNYFKKLREQEMEILKERDAYNDMLEECCYLKNDEETFIKTMNEMKIEGPLTFEECDEEEEENLCDEDVENLSTKEYKKYLNKFIRAIKTRKGG